MRVEMRQETRARLAVVRATLELARWGFRRNIEPVEALSLAMALGWLVSLAIGDVFGTASSYTAMAQLSGGVARWGWLPEWPWAVAIGVIAAHLGVAYALGAWGYLRAGHWDDDDGRIRWSRRVRFGGLMMLAAWWMFIAVMFGLANFAGVGWKIYVPLSLWTSWSAIRLVWDYGAGVLPLMRRRGA